MRKKNEKVRGYAHFDKQSLQNLKYADIFASDRWQITIWLFEEVVKNKTESAILDLESYKNSLQLQAGVLYPPRFALQCYWKWEFTWMSPFLSIPLRFEFLSKKARLTAYHPTIVAKYLAIILSTKPMENLKNTVSFSFCSFWRKYLKTIRSAENCWL